MKKLNFACGEDIKKDWDNCDIQRHKNIIYCDANKFPYPFEENTYLKVLLRQCLYIFGNPKKVLNEIWRICKPNAEIEIIIPHYHNKGAYNDLSSKHYFSESSFEAFVNDTCTLEKEDKFDIIKIDSTPSKIGKWMPKKLRKKLSLFIGGLVSEIHVKFVVNK